MPIYKDPALVLCYCLVVSRRVKLEFAYFVQFYDARCEKRFVYLNGTTRSRWACVFMQPNRYIFMYIFQYLLIQWHWKPSSDSENAQAVMDLLYPHIWYEPFFSSLLWLCHIYGFSLMWSFNDTMPTADNAAKAVPLLQFFFVCASVVSYVLSF